MEINKQKPSSFCTICTNKCAFELVGLLLSLSIYHPNEIIYILCDSKTKESIDNMSPNIRLNMKWFIELDKYSDKTRNEMEIEGIWGDFLKNKMSVINKALENEEDTLFLDSDMVILDEINEIEKDKKVGLSPQFIAKKNVEETGYYNAGMLWTNSKEVIDYWIEITDPNNSCAEQINMKKLEKYEYFTFGENYNLQCWRYYLSPEGSQQVEKNITSSDRLYYKNKPIKNVHTHFCGGRYDKFNSIILRHLKNTRNFKILSIIYRIIHNKWIIHIPKQPMHGLGYHANDSFRELAVLFQNHYKDVKVCEKETMHCWIEPNILCYDRPTLEWINKEVTDSSLFLLGNGNIEVEGKQLKSNNPGLSIKPWIFWPRNPKLLESILDEEDILSYQSRPIESIFIGNFENHVQEKYRKSDIAWESVLHEYHCTKGSKHKFTPREYLMKLRKSKFGLCLRGYGSKCHREVELMAFGTVPLITSEVSVKSYMEPLIENKHYIYVKNPEELKIKVANIQEKDWVKMSQACYEWYQRNVHSKQCWNNMINHILH